MTAVLPLVLPLTYPTILRTASPDRATERRKWDFESGDYGPFASFARTGAGTAFTVAGYIQQFASSVPRVTDRGLLLEPEATNLLPYYGPAAAQLHTMGGTVSNVTAPVIAPILGNWISVNGNTSTVGYAVQRAVIPKDRSHTLQILIETPDDAPPIIGNGNSASYNLSLVVGNAITQPPYTLKRLAGRVWWVWVASPEVTSFETHGVYKYTLQTYRPLKYSGWQLELGKAPSSPIITTGAAATRGAESAALIVPARCTKWEVVYGDTRTVASGSGLTPGASFDLVSGRPWIGLNNELKSVRFAP